MGTFDRKAQEVAAAAAEQKYLLGARLLGQLTQEQQAVFQLMSGVGDQLSALKALREECQNGVTGPGRASARDQPLLQPEHAGHRRDGTRHAGLGGTVATAA